MSKKKIPVTAVRKVHESKSKKYQKLDGKSKTMGISLSHEQWITLKEYAQMKNVSISSLIMGSVDFDSMTKELEASE